MYKIYKIIDNTNSNVYIGRTRRTLKVRLREHKNSQKCSSVDIIKNGDYRIELIEETHDKMRERYWILNTDCCVNKNIPGRTNIEWRKDNKEKIREQKKEYKEKNKEKYKEYYKEYYQDNKDETLEYQKEWREKNKDHLANYKKEYQEKNKEKIKRRRKNRHLWMSSMGGSPYKNNMSLLKIDPNLFN